MSQQILDKTKKKKIIAELAVFGITKIPYLLLKTGGEKIWAYSGDFSSDELRMLNKVLPIMEMGIYFAKESINRDGKRDVRMSLDGAHVLKEQIKSNIIDVNAGQEKDWFLGNDFEVSEGQVSGGIKGGCFVILKSGEDIIGVGRLDNNKRIVSNYMPKERRVKN